MKRRDRKCGDVAAVGLRGVAGMSVRFTDEEFDGAWRELDEPQLDGGWELFTETMGVRIYRLYDQVPGCHRSDTGSRPVPAQRVRPVCVS